MANKKRIALRSLAASVLACVLSTLVAYVWTGGGAGLGTLVVWFVAVVSLVGAAVLATLLQVIFIKLGKKQACIAAAVIGLALVGLGLWGYSF